MVAAPGLLSLGTAAIPLSISLQSPALQRLLTINQRTHRKNTHNFPSAQVPPFNILLAPHILHDALHPGEEDGHASERGADENSWCGRGLGIDLLSGVEDGVDGVG